MDDIAQIGRSSQILGSGRHQVRVTQLPWTKLRTGTDRGFAMSPNIQADLDQLNRIIADPLQRARLRELVEKVIQHRINIEDTKCLVEGLELSAHMDLKINPSIYKRLVTKVARRVGEPQDIDALVAEVVKDIETP
jgi:hypothetical protein